MALVMVHLLVAREWAMKHPEYLNCPEYYYGAIAPDAIHVRDGNDKSHKNAIHFHNWSGSRPQLMREYWLSHHTPFDVGYAIHCLTDGLWVDGYKSAFPGILLPDGRADPHKYYNDVYATERALYAETANMSQLLDWIANAQTPQDHPQLRAHEFEKWRENVLREYDVNCPAIGAWRTKSYREMGLPDPDDHDPVYITPRYIRDFMRTTCEKIEDIIRRYDSVNEVLNTIEERRSIRAYEPTPIPEGDLQTIMTAALQSPSARNIQPWHFSVITNRALLDEFDDALNPERPVTYKAPAVVVISAPIERSFFAKIDCGIAVQNMALAAWSLGYGSVILGAPKIVFDGDRCDEFKQKFDIPADHEYIIGIAIGKAAGTKEAHELHPEKISWIK